MYLMMFLRRDHHRLFCADLEIKYLMRVKQTVSMRQAL